MKISIRLTILTLLSALLIFIGSLTILINYYADTKILLDLTKRTVNLSGTYVERRISSFLQPVHDSVILGANVIEHDIVDINDPIKFKEFLLQIINNQPMFYAVYWGDAEGNFINVERTKNNSFNYWRQSCANDYCQESSMVIDSNGNKISALTTKLSNFIPAKRPWYVKAVKEKKYVLSDLYLFFHTPAYGITASVPVYNDGNISGVFGVDLRLNTISEFVDQTKITKNSMAFIFDNDGHLVAAPGLDKGIVTQVPKIDDLKIPWLSESYKIYNKDKRSTFLYNYDNQRYFAFYKDISIITGNNWVIAIVFPLDDIMGPLSVILKTSFLVVLLTLLIGISFAWIISGTMSRPIVKLARDAMTIKSLDFSTFAQMKTNIKEIHEMQDAFSSMNQSLQSFVRYVPFNLVKNLLATGGIAHVGGDSRKITALFTDIQGFTSLSEKMPSDDLMGYLSEYFEAMSKVIIQYSGTIDKYIGDAIMAFWGAPLDDSLHAFHACQCALEMRVSLENLNKYLKEQGMPEITIRIGINTGFAVVGNVGSNDRLSYTAIGDSINVGSRLQDLNKLYKSEILVSGATYELVKHFFHFRLLDHVAVRGKKDGIYVYQMLLPRDSLVNVLDSYNNEFKGAFDNYQNGKWDVAIHLFQKMTFFYPDDVLIKVLLERCIYFKNNPPEDWHGIWRLDLCT